MDDGEEPAGITPIEVARRMAAAGVIVDPASVWRYVLARFAEADPAAAASLPASAARLPVAPDDVDAWLDDFLDGVEQARARIVRALGAARSEEDGERDAPLA